MRTHKCPCPCGCSHLEPLCMHTYTNKYTYIPSQIPLYITRAVQSHTCTCHCECSQLEPLCIHILAKISIVYIYRIMDSNFYMNPCCANSHVFVPLRVLALSLCIHAYTHKHTYIISYRLLVYEPMLCELTYVCALAGAHAWNLFVFTHMLTSRHISYYRYSCSIWFRVV